MSKITKIIKKKVFGKKAFQSFFRRLFFVSMEGMNIGTGGGDIHRNGDSFTIGVTLLPLVGNNPVVFDVGAQGGEYTEEVLRVTQGKVRVYAFEPCLRDYELLKKEFDAIKEVALFQSALGDSNCEATLYYPENMHGLSSFYKHDGRFKSSEKVKIETIDSFCQNNDIKMITLLKLDTEGSELACLRGAKNMLPSIQNIHFEMGMASRASRTYFKDFFEFLSDYKIYRVLMDGLYEITSAETITELLFTTNYLAIRKEGGKN